MSSRSVSALAAFATIAGLLLGLASPAQAVAGPLQPGAPARLAAIIYAQPPSPLGGLYQSSRNGSDYDKYVWDNFGVSAGQFVTITEIQWRGGYDPTRFGSGGPVLDFTVAIYPSIPGGSQPDVIHPPLVEYQTGGAAGETFAGTFGNTRMYDYDFVLPAPFSATSPGPYWVYIEATQGGIPDWGMSAGSGGDGVHFLGMPVVGDIAYFKVGGDTAFTLLGALSPWPKVYLPVIFRP